MSPGSTSALPASGDRKAEAAWHAAHALSQVLVTHGLDPRRVTAIRLEPTGADGLGPLRLAVDWVHPVGDMRTSWADVPRADHPAVPVVERHRREGACVLDLGADA